MLRLVQDLRLAFRSLLKSPGYAAVVVATLALGIAGATTMFTLVDGVLLKPLPYAEPDRLVLLYESIPEFRERYPVVPVNAFHFKGWQQEAGSFESMSLFTWNEETLSDPGEPRRAAVARVDSRFFRTLGVRMALGRDFRPEETVPGSGTTVLVTDRFWRRELEADPNALGRELALNGRKYEVAGVLPSGFKFFDPARIGGPFGSDLGDIEIVRPFEIPQEVEEPTGEFNFAAIGRLKAGVRPDEAKAELDVLQAALASEAEMPMALESLVEPLRRTIVANSSAGLWLGLAAVGMVLLIGCVNIANLSLARASGREPDYATRAALGAGRAALVRQSMIESSCLATTGGALGVWLSYAGVAWFRAHAPVDLPRLDELSVDVRVLAFAVAVTALSAALVGLLPALRVSGVRPLAALSRNARGSVGSRGSRRLGDWLAGGEVALSAALLIVSGLLIHSLVAVLDQDLGFDAEKTVTARLSLPPAEYRNRDSRLAALRSILLGLESLPGVESAGFVTLLPLTQEDAVNPVLPAEAASVPILERPMANFRWASPGFFDAMGIRIVEGRDFREEETVERGVLISVSTAERLWPGQSPIGRQIRPGDDSSPNYEVVGVVSDTPIASLERGSPMAVYRHYADGPRNSMQLALRSSQDAASLTPAVRQTVWNVEPQAPSIELAPAADLVAAATSERSFQAALLAFFAVVALALASLGVYSVLAQTLNARTREMGLRMALGARASQVRGLVLSQGMRPVVWGLVVGCVAAAGASRLLSTMLFEISPLDPLTFAAAPALLIAVALGACLIPARRAGRLDPAESLRSD